MKMANTYVSSSPGSHMLVWASSAEGSLEAINAWLGLRLGARHDVITQLAAMVAGEGVMVCCLFPKSALFT
jgi:hypothetical protein